MKIAEFITSNVLRPRLLAKGCLVVYDPEQRLRDLCLDMATDKVRVVDAGAGSLAGRQAMQQALRDLGRPTPALDGLLLYVPAAAPLTEEAMQANPYSAASACGAVFPSGPADDYEQLCLRARPDHQTDIRRLFAQTPGGPAFAVIDAVAGGFGWPQLKAALQVESGREILLALLAPNGAQLSALKASEGWASEARDFFKATLGLKLQTRGKTWSAVADEVWRFVLFSEFAFDLPGDLPAALPDALQPVPRAPAEARTIVEYACETLRSDPRSQPEYVERAKEVQNSLNLPDLCRSLEDLGQRETFPFEERSVLRRTLQALTAGQLDAARDLVARHKTSVWRGQEDSQAQWQLMHATLGLVQACDDFERGLPEHTRSLGALLDHYVTALREADRLQREFEQSAGEYVDALGLLDGAVRHARGSYRQLAERAQAALMKHMESAAWPLAGRLQNVDVFDRFAAGPLAEQGRRVAYVMVDALRYELGVTLERMLAEDGPVSLHAACAQLPTVTPVGMASLLPGAASGLTLALQGDALTPLLAGQPVSAVAQRMEAFRKVYGDRFAELRLDDFAKGRAKAKDAVDLLVLRSTEIDAQLESSPETALALVPGTLKMIRVALHKLRAAGFTDAVIVTDHGFFLNAQAEAGDVCVKPTGSWPVIAHDRLAVGAGTSDTHNLVLAPEKLGIKAQGFTQAALPRSLAPYRAGHLYFHGGLSLQEAVVPVLVAKLQRADDTVFAQAEVRLSYKNGAKRITTQVPVFDIELVSVGLFSHGAPVEVLVEAQDKNGNVVGEARPGGEVNPATGTLMLQPGEAKKIVLRMTPEFEGKVSVKALNPTTLQKLASIDLEVEYTR
jgi:hypothetical protein